MKPWDDLPNSQYIYQLLDHVNSNSKVWDSIFCRISKEEFMAAWMEARDNLSDKMVNYWKDILDNLQGWTSDLIYDNNLSVNFMWAIRGSLLALISYDDSSKYLKISSEKLKMITALTCHPATILLQPYLIALEATKMLTTNPHCDIILVLN